MTAFRLAHLTAAVVDTHGEAFAVAERLASTTGNRTSVRRGVRWLDGSFCWVVRWL